VTITARTTAGAITGAELDGVKVFKGVPYAARRQKLADEMSEAWIGFARTADPNHRGLPTWPSYTLPGRATMTFNRGECAIVDDPSSEARELWSRIDASLF
jgi:carboxylesterase type B